MSSATTALVTSTTGGAALTVTVSVSSPTARRTASDAVWPARTSTSGRRVVRKPASSTVTT